MKISTYSAGFYALLILMSAATGASADPGEEVTRGQLMAASCQACHNAAGAQEGMPDLSTLSPGVIGSQLRAFRDGQREATIMDRHAKGYTDEEIDAMASYFDNR